MRISDWSSDVCSSDLRDDVDALALFRNAHGSRPPAAVSPLSQGTAFAEGAGRSSPDHRQEEGGLLAGSRPPREREPSSSRQRYAPLGPRNPIPRRPPASPRRQPPAPDPRPPRNR